MVVSSLLRSNEVLKVGPGFEIQSNPRHFHSIFPPQTCEVSPHHMGLVFVKVAAPHTPHTENCRTAGLVRFLMPSQLVRFLPTPTMTVVHSRSLAPRLTHGSGFRLKCLASLVSRLSAVAVVLVVLLFMSSLLSALRFSLNGTPCNKTRHKQPSTSS